MSIGSSLGLRLIGEVPNRLGARRWFAQGVYTSSDRVLVSKENGLLRIQMNSPKTKNALDIDSYRTITRSLQHANKDSDVKVIMLTGTGQFYSSGNDLNNFKDMLSLEVFSKLDASRDILIEFVNSMIDSEKVLVAMVNGPSIGIVVTTMGLCDYVYATPDAYFYTPFKKLGITPEGCSSATFPKILGPTIAHDMLFKNRKLNSKEALEAGFIHGIVDMPNADKAAEFVREKILGCPQKLQAPKRLLYHFTREELRQVSVREAHELRQCWTSPASLLALARFILKV